MNLNIINFKFLNVGFILRKTIIITSFKFRYLNNLNVNSHNYNNVKVCKNSKIATHRIRILSLWSLVNNYDNIRI